MTLKEFRQSETGQRLSGLLTNSATIARMTAYSRAGRPAVKAIDAEVAAQIGPLTKVERQHVGRWVRDLMAKQGLRPIKQIEWRGGQAFTSGSVYAPIATAASPAINVANDKSAARLEAARAILRAANPNAAGPADTVDSFLADRRRAWGEA